MLKLFNRMLSFILLATLANIQTQEKKLIYLYPFDTTEIDSCDKWERKFAEEINAMQKSPTSTLAEIDRWGTKRTIEYFPDGTIVSLGKHKWPWPLIVNALSTIVVTATSAKGPAITKTAQDITKWNELRDIQFIRIRYIIGAKKIAVTTFSLEESTFYAQIIGDLEENKQLSAETLMTTLSPLIKLDI